jgi:hypothetical protein
MSADFLIEVQQRMVGDNPVTELQKTEAGLRSAMGQYKQFESAVTNSAKGLERVGASIAGVRGKMQKAMEAGDSAKFWKLSEALTKLEDAEGKLKTSASAASASLKAQQGVVSGLADKMDDLRKAEKQAGDAGKSIDIEGTAGGIKKLGGPLGGAGDMVEEYSEAWGKLSGALGPAKAGLAVAGVAVVALAAIVIAGAAAFVKYALSMANASRDSKLMTKALQVSVGAGDELGAAMKNVQRDTGMAADRQRDIIRSLNDAGVAAKDMPDALRAIAIQETALGDTSGTQALIDSMKDGKKSASQLASEMDSKFGGIVKDRMLGLDQQSATLSQNISGLFDGLNIEPVLQAFSKFVALFDSSSATGKVLKETISGLLQPLIDGAPGAMNSLIRGFLKAIIWCKQLSNDLKTIDKALQFDLGSLGKIDGTAVAGNSALTVMTGGLWGLGDAVEGLSFDALAADFQKIGGWGTSAINSIKAAFPGATAALTSFGSSISSFASTALEKATAVGTAIITGITNAIKAGAAAVASAIGSVADGAISAAKSKLGIKSPSKVFGEIGDQTVAGFVNNVEAGEGEAQSAMSSLVEAPEASPSAVPGGGSSGGVTVNFAGAVFNFGGEDPEADAERFVTKVMQVFEGIALQVGAPLPAGP